MLTTLFCETYRLENGYECPSVRDRVIPAKVVHFGCVRRCISVAPVSNGRPSYSRDYGWLSVAPDRTGGPWEPAPGQALTPAAQTIEILVYEREYASGEIDEGRIQEPDVQYQQDAAIVTIKVRKKTECAGTSPGEQGTDGIEEAQLGRLHIRVTLVSVGAVIHAFGWA